MPLKYSLSYFQLPQTLLSLDNEFFPQSAKGGKLFVGSHQSKNTTDMSFLHLCFNTVWQYHLCAGSMFSLKIFKDGFVIFSLNSYLMHAPTSPQQIPRMCKIVLGNKAFSDSDSDLKWNLWLSKFKKIIIVYRHWHCCDTFNIYNSTFINVHLCGVLLRSD